MTGCEDTGYHCPGNDNDSDRYTKLDPLAQRFFRVSGSNVARGRAVVGITRAIRRAIIKSVVAGHGASGRSVTKGLGEGEGKEKKDESESEEEERKRLKWDNKATRPHLTLLYNQTTGIRPKIQPRLPSQFPCTSM